MIAKIKVLHSDSIMPTRGSDKAAGYDLYAHLDSDEIIIKPHETVLIGTGVSITPPEGYFGAIFARSGIATSQGLRPANCIGVCDEDYTGEYRIALHNDTDIPQMVTNKSRIAQLVFLPYINVYFDIVEELDKTERGASGFGSTGNK